MFEDNPKYLLFVYGTLRPGAKNHHVVRPFLKDGPIPTATLQGYQMYSFGRFPGIISAPLNPMPVEGNLLYFEDDLYEEAIQTIDQYEGEGWTFKRVQVTVRMDYMIPPLAGPAWTYIVQERVLRIVESNLIESNNWFEHVRV